MTLHDALAEIAADVLATKARRRDYWRAKGRERFGRELADDDLDAATIAEVLSTVDDAQVPEVSLDAILEELKRRG